MWNLNRCASEVGANTAEVVLTEDVEKVVIPARLKLVENSSGANFIVWKLIFFFDQLATLFVAHNVQ